MNSRIQEFTNVRLGGTPDGDLKGVVRMSQKILFLDDGNVTARRLKRALASPDRICVDARDEEALREHLAGGAAIIVHVPSDPRRFAAIVGRATLDFPRVPFLHVIEERSFIATDWLKGPLHEWVGITASIETVLRRIANLTHIASLENEVRASRERAGKVDYFTRSIRGIETVPVLKSAMAILREELGSSNVLWFPEDTIHKEIERYFQSKNAIPLQSRPAVRVPWISLGEITPACVEQMFDAWGLMTKVTGGLDAEALEMSKAEEGKRDLIVPVRSAASILGTARPYGHLVFLEPTRYEELRGTVLLNTYFDLLAQQLEETYAYGRLQAMTYKDDLTDLYNQRYLPVVLEQELNRASRNSKEFSVLFCDVDFFKSVNDTKGHMVGSRVLVELSKILKGSIRSTDFAFRYGGDEYVIVLSGANSKNAAQVAERLRQRAAGTTFDVGGNQVQITVSIGVATYPEHARSTDEIMQMADEAMYYGKHKSRNVVSVAS